MCVLRAHSYLTPLQLNSGVRPPNQHMEHVRIEYPFVTPTEERGYMLFPDVIENDPRILFRGTSEAELASVIQNGFAIRGSSPSVSFADRSSLPLRYACESRKSSGDRGVVIAAQFRNPMVPFAKFENGIVHVYRFEEQPQIHGYCIVPADYVFR